jgi:hypothetical protein
LEEQLIYLAAAIAAGIEWLKQPVLKPLKARYNLSDFYYSLLIYFLTGIAATVVVFAQPEQWDVLKSATAFGYPQWVGNILAIFLVTGGNQIVHAAWEILKRLGNMSEPNPPSTT